MTRMPRSKLAWTSRASGTTATVSRDGPASRSMVRSLGRLASRHRASRTCASFGTAKCPGSPYVAVVGKKAGDRPPRQGVPPGGRGDWVDRDRTKTSRVFWPASHHRATAGPGPCHVERPDLQPRVLLGIQGGRPPLGSIGRTTRRPTSSTRGSPSGDATRERHGWSRSPGSARMWSGGSSHMRGSTGVSRLWSPRGARYDIGPEDAHFWVASTGPGGTSNHARLAHARVRIHGVLPVTAGPDAELRYRPTWNLK